MNGRGLICAIAASGAIGGLIGSLATAATQSNASPAAIAAAIQRVQDATADRQLKLANDKLEAISKDLRIEPGILGAGGTATDFLQKIACLGEGRSVCP